eukprot:gene12070-14122_t
MPQNPNCTAYGSVGDACNDMQELMCFGGLTCDKTTSKCKALNYAVAGETCTTADDCALGADFKPIMECTNGVCTKIAVDNCLANSTCPFGQFCGTAGRDKACQPTIALGQPCQPEYSCATGTVCSPDADGQGSTCIAPFTKTEGQKCSAPTLLYGDGMIPVSDCKVSSGLTCIDGYCKLLDAPSSANCSATACGTDQSCVCESFTSATGVCRSSSVYNQACQDSLQAIIACAIKNKCKDDLSLPMSASPGICLYTHCNEAMCSNKCIANTQVTDPTTCPPFGPYGACKPLTPTTTTTTTTSSSTATTTTPTSSSPTPTSPVSSSSIIIPSTVGIVSAIIVILL